MMLAWACLLGTSLTASGERVWSLADKAGAIVCSVWFVVAVCLFFHTYMKGGRKEVQSKIWRQENEKQVRLHPVDSVLE